MVCFEGIALNLNVFRQRIDFPNYRLVHPPSGELEKVFVKPDVCFSYIVRSITDCIKLTCLSPP